MCVVLGFVESVGQIVPWAEWVTWIDKFWCKSMSFSRGLKLAVSLKIDMGLKFDVGLKLCESQDVQALTFFKLIFPSFFIDKNEVVVKRI